MRCPGMSRREIHGFMMRLMRRIRISGRTEEIVISLLGVDVNSNKF